MMRTKRQPKRPTAYQRNGEGRSDDRVPHDASVPTRNPSGTQSDVQYSPSGDPDGRRDDDVEPTPEGPNTRARGDSDVEGVHDRSNSDIERE
jgi:hypothetical protein